jgi:hypothetical protein
MEYIDPKNGMVWTRSEDLCTWTNAEGFSIIGTSDMSFEQIVNIYADYLAQPSPKSDADRIAELEAKLAALLSRL